MRFVIYCIFLSGLLLLSLSNISAAEQNLKDPKKNKLEQYIIGPGDVLEVSVWNEPDISKTVIVRLDSRISMPLVGDVIVAGISPKDLSIFLTHKFSRYISNPNVAVILKESRSKRYYIIGQIKTPGEFPLDYPLTVLQALARAGGFMEWADPGKIIIMRPYNGKETIHKFDYHDVIKGKNLYQNIKILPGDTIVVP